MNKSLILVGGVLLVALAFIFVGKGDSTTTPEVKNKAVETTSNADTDSDPYAEVAPGTYVINTESSIINWAGKKPLIDGYVNTGTINITEGQVTIGEDGSGSGSLTIDMNTLKVGLTAKKPDQETALEGHLKGDRWFNVEKYPTATFAIRDIESVPSEQDNFDFNIIGDLTMKGTTHEVIFPAKVYQMEDGTVSAEAATEIDRTKWDITAGSGSFFDDLADNVIDDMISLSFTLKATK